MKLLKTIWHKDIVAGAHGKKKINYRLRIAARAVVFDNQDRVALLNVSKIGYYKLPGGGS